MTELRNCILTEVVTIGGWDNESNDNKDNDDYKNKYWKSVKDRNYRKGMTKWETMTTKKTAIYRSW